jgi:type II secretory pathway component GspD/PulD (secretin)
MKKRFTFLGFPALLLFMTTTPLAMLAGMSSAHAATESRAPVQFKAGEMQLLPFLEMVSEKLDLPIDASGLGDPANLESVTLPATAPLPYDRAKELVLTTLTLQGYTWILDGQTGHYRVVRQREARDQEIPLIVDRQQLPDSSALVTYALPVKHVSPEFVARIMRSFMPAYARIIPIEATHSVLITDTAKNVSKLHRLIESIDTPEAQEQARKELAAAAKNAEKDGCAESGSIPFGGTPPAPWLWISLFSLIALVIGFLARGYAIRRIEGGL